MSLSSKGIVSPRCFDGIAGRVIQIRLAILHSCRGVIAQGDRLTEGIGDDRGILPRAAPIDPCRSRRHADTRLCILSGHGIAVDVAKAIEPIDFGDLVGGAGRGDFLGLAAIRVVRCVIGGSGDCRAPARRTAVGDLDLGRKVQTPRACRGGNGTDRPRGPGVTGIRRSRIIIGDCRGDRAKVAVTVGCPVIDRGGGHQLGVLGSSHLVAVDRRGAHVRKVSHLVSRCAQS